MIGEPSNQLNRQNIENINGHLPNQPNEPNSIQSSAQVNKGVSIGKPKSSIAEVIEIKEDEDKSKRIINFYIANLHRYLGNYCFISGAYVIEDDNDRRLFKFLKRVYNLSLPPITHEGFMKNPNITVFNMFEMKINIEIQCQGCHGPNGSVVVTNLKWYPFSQTIDGNENNYVYLKLERDSTLTLIHWYHYGTRHFGTPKPDRCPPRWEDCKKPIKSSYISTKNQICTDEDDSKPRSASLCNPKVCRIGINPPLDGYTIPSYNFSHVFINNDVTKERIEIKENYQRHGDEFFIPKKVSEFLLDNSHKIILFEHNNDDNSVKISTEDVNIAELAVDMKRKRKYYFSQPTQIQDSIPYSIKPEDVEEEKNDEASQLNITKKLLNLIRTQKNNSSFSKLLTELKKFSINKLKLGDSLSRFIPRRRASYSAPYTNTPNISNPIRNPIRNSISGGYTRKKKRKKIRKSKRKHKYHKHKSRKNTIS